MTGPDDPDQPPQGWTPTAVHGGQGVQVGGGNTQHNTYHQHTTHRLREARTVVWPVRVGSPPSVADHYQPRHADAEVVEALAARNSAILVGAFTDTGAGVVVRGQGGVGKSQTAARLAWSLWPDPELDVMVWVNALSRDAVLTAYADTATQVLCERHPDIDTRPPQEAARLLRAWLASTDRQWLIVLDDLQHLEDLRDLWPPHRPRGRVVVTTRHRDSTLGHGGRVIVELDVFTETEAVDYLRGVLPADTDPDDLRGLATDLGGLPLALAQAAAFVQDKPLLTVAGYRERLADRRRALHELMPTTDQLPDYHRDTVAVTWSLSIEHADTLRPQGLAQPVLRLLALLDPNGTPPSVLTGTGPLEHLATVTGRTVNSDDVADALDVLHRLSLATIGPDQSIRVHALLQRAVRDTLTDDTLTALAHIAATGLLDTWPEIDTRHAALAQALRSCTTALHDITTPALLTPDVHAVLFRTGRSLGTAGQVQAAATHFARLHHDTTQHLSSDHPDILTIRAHLAYWQGEAGDPAGAVVEFEALFADRLRVLGPDHPDTLATRKDLGYWLGEAGDPAGAVVEFKALLADRLRVLGPDHPDTLTTLTNLAHWQGEVDDPAGAVVKFEALLADRLRVLGPDHPDTFNTRGDLAYWRGKAGNLTGAIAESEALLADRLRVLGPDHPYTQRTRGRLAYWQGEAGDPAGAVVEFEALLADQLRVLGPDHPYTLDTRGDLAYWRAEAGDPAGAVVEFEALLADQLRVLGPDHPYILNTRAHLARQR